MDYNDAWGGIIQIVKKALQKYTYVYTYYTGGAGALATDSIKNVKVYII